MTVTELVARPYSASSDREGCLALVDSNVPEYFLAADRDEVASFLDRLSETGVRYFVFEDPASSRLVACGGVAVGTDADARMCWGMVERGLHRRGLGRILLFLRLVAGARMGAKTASLTTISAVSGFFEGEGFALTGGVDDYYAPGMHRRDYAIALDDTTKARLEARLVELSAGRVQLRVDETAGAI